MKICLVGDGNSIHLQRWSDWLMTHGHQVNLIHLGTFNGESGKHFSSWNLVDSSSGMFGFASKILPIRKLIKRIKPDIVHGHYMTGAGFYAAMSGHPRVVTSAWGSDIYQDMNQPMKARIIRYALKHSDVVLGDSWHLVRTIKTISPKSLVEMVVFGIDTELFKPIPDLKLDRFTFLSSRATTATYNPLLILQAFEIFDEPDSQLLFQELQTSYPEFSKALDDSPNLHQIFFWKRRPNVEMRSIYNSAHVSISCPDSDSSGVSLLESMSCEVPVIAMAIPQNEEWVIDGENGYAFDINSPESLADKMEEAYRNTDLYLMGQKAREKVTLCGQFDNEMRKVEEIYESLM